MENNKWCIQSNNCVSVFLFWNGEGSFYNFVTLPWPQTLESLQKLYCNLHRSIIPYWQVQIALKTKSCFESSGADLKWPRTISGLFIPISVTINKFHGRNLDVWTMLPQTLLRGLSNMPQTILLKFQNSGFRNMPSRSCGPVGPSPVVEYSGSFQVLLLQNCCREHVFYVNLCVHHCFISLT